MLHVWYFYLRWVIFRANVGKYSIHGAYGYVDVVLLRMDAGAGNGQFPYQFMGDAPNGNVVIAMSVCPVPMYYYHLISLILVKQCHKQPMTGNGLYIPPTNL
jgi:hypothetical protein